MRRRFHKKNAFLAPAGNLIKKLSNADSRLRRRVLKVSLWGLAGLFTMSLLFGTYSIPRIVKLEIKKEALIETNRRLTVDLVDADRVRDMLRDDALYIEDIARTRYYMVRPNEIIYRYRGR
jgi:cell division protein FtsB